MNTPQFIVVTLGSTQIAVNVHAITIITPKDAYCFEGENCVLCLGSDRNRQPVSETMDEVLAKIAALREPVQNKLGEREVVALERLAAFAGRLKS